MEKNKLQKKTSVTVTDLDSATRIDKYLFNFKVFPSRSQATNAIDKELVSINGKVAKTSTTVNNGDLIEVFFAPENIKSKSEAVLNVVYEDEDVLVINKPAGLLVHPTGATQHTTLVDALKAYSPSLSRGYAPDRPGIVHRLDRDTSGLLIVAKTDEAQDNLHAQFKNKTISRIYWAVTFGSLSPDHGTIASYLIRNPSQRTKRMSLRDSKTKQIVRPGTKSVEGRIAITHYKNLQTGPEGLSLVELKLETGRTHQIRVHLQESGTPIAGDSFYASKTFREKLRSKTLRDFLTHFSRCALHAKEISFAHPRTQKVITAAAPLPDDYKKLLSLSGLTCPE